MRRRSVIQPDLFDAAGGDAGEPRSGKPGPPPDTGFIVTNHLNLMYMMAAGLLMPPSGFGGKHYADPQADFQGWLPLFVRVGDGTGAARRSAIRRATKEAAHLRLVLIEVNLQDLNGPGHLLGDAGWSTRRIEQGIAVEEWLLLVPAPLPACRIRRVLFRSAKDHAETLDDAAERSNVPLASIASGVADTDWFEGEVGGWPPAGGPEERAATGLEAGRACGGALALVSHLAEEGMVPARLRAAAFGRNPDPLDRADALDRLIVEAPDGWFVARPKAERASSVVGRVVGKVRRAIQLSLTWASPASSDDDTQPIQTREDLLWKAVARLIDHRRERSRMATDPSLPATDSSLPPAPDALRVEDVLLGFLRESTPRLEGDLLDETVALVSTLDSLRGGLGAGTVSEMFARHQASFSRAVILFFLRRRSDELLGLLGQYPQLTERDRLESALLFGVRDGWLKLPLRLRGSPELASVVMHRMAAVAHATDGSGLGLGEPPGLSPAD